VTDCSKEKKKYLDIKQVGIGRMRLLTDNKDALRILAVTMQLLNKQYLNGPLDLRKKILRDKLSEATSRSGAIQFCVKRENIVYEAWNRFSHMTTPGNAIANIKVSFINESGYDAGGLSKEFMSILQRELFNPESGLWAPASSAFKYECETSKSSTTELFAPLLPRAHPDTEISRRTGLSLENLYELSGIVAARTFADCIINLGKSQLPYRLASSVFKHVLSLGVTCKDFENDDPSFYKSTVRYILENEVDSLELQFCEDLFTLDGSYVESICLDPESPNYYASPRKQKKSSGKEEFREVTDENKELFLEERAKYRLCEAMRPYLDAFRKGFLKAIKEDDLAILTPNEIVSITCASSKIDPEDMVNNIDFCGCDLRHKEWLKEAIRTFSETERRMFMLFVTGSICPPQGGFSKLSPRLSVSGFYSTNSLPRSHTCFNRLDLPLYNSYNVLFTKLLIAIKEGCDYYAMS